MSGREEKRAASLFAEMQIRRLLACGFGGCAGGEMVDSGRARSDRSIAMAAAGSSPRLAWLLNRKLTFARVSAR